MQGSIKYGSEEISYTLCFRDRKTLGITVNPDRSIEVNAPIGSDLEKIKQKIHKRAAWILKQQDHFLTFEPRSTKRRFVSGESHLYLGRQYQLLIVKSEEEKVKHTGRNIEVRTSDAKNVEKLLETWYLEKSKIWFHKIALPLIEHFKKHKVAPDKIEIRKMKNRWGSCSNNGQILLNSELIKAPKACIEYVIIHELCHLIHRDHTQVFFDLQKKEFPEWTKWKNKLELLLA
jgi:predicted metal-dependent hydrolase